MSEVDIDTRIRDICQEILKEQDPTKVEELLALLRSLVSTAQDESRTRMRFIASYYRNRIQSLSGAQTQPPEQLVSRIPALLRFLGLRPDLKLERE
jgi:hypothetical protein